MNWVIQILLQLLSLQTSRFQENTQANAATWCPIVEGQQQGAQTNTSQVLNDQNTFTLK